MKQHHRPVILLIIDSLMHLPLQEAIRQERTPALRFFMEHGQYFPNVVSSFPTMSVTIDSSLLTGTYPDRHQVPGLLWYHETEKRIVNYGNGKRELLKIGIKQVLLDTLYRLNNEHLNQDVKTIHEELALHETPSASINGLIYRGSFLQQFNIPKLAIWLKLLPQELRTHAPLLFSFGALARLYPENRYGQLWRRGGFSDKFSAQELKYLIQQQKLPFFNIVYFPENDHSVHKNGPMDISGIEKVDRQLQEVLSAYDSWEEALHRAIWVVMGDSGQTPIGASRNQALIYLLSILSMYRISKLGKQVQKTDQLFLCVNERMAYIYALHDNLPLSEVAAHLQRDERIDVIAWKEEEMIQVRGGGKESTLAFRPNGPYQDPYQQTWILNGDVSLLDIQVTEETIEYNDYPDALARLYGALHSHSGRYLVITAKPGCEFVGESSPTHQNGAGHGALHKQDSLVSMIICGTNIVPQYPRVVDVKDWILHLYKEQHP
jgi:hypothetical protein